VIGTLPLVSITSPFRRAVIWIVTGLVVPWMVRSPVASTLISFRSAGTLPRSIGLVVVNVAFGNSAVLRMRPCTWLSRLSESLFRPVRSAVKVASSTVVPSIVIVPVTPVVRPAASVLCPKRTSWAR
jgi:hypothetical protein